MDRFVSIHEQGRSGTVTYHEGGHSLACHWEFGGGEVVAIVQCGDEGHWKAQPWAEARRPAILRFVADEVVRQKAGNCRADIDERTGDILLRLAAPSPARKPEAAGWVFRLGTLRMKLGLAVLVGSVILGAAVWIKDTVFSIDPGKGAPVGLSLRTDRHIATLIQTLEPYTPSPNRDHGRDTYRISLFLVPLDGSPPRLIPIKGGLAPNAFSLARILGGDDRHLWFNVAGTGGVDLGTFELLPEETVARARHGALPEPRRNAPLTPRPEHHLAAGLMLSPSTWLGLHSAAEVARDFKPGGWLKPVVHAENAKQSRRFHRGLLEPDAASGYRRMVSMRLLGDAEYLNAAFLRRDEVSQPIRLAAPPGALVVYTSAPGLKGTLVMARVDEAGRVLWTTDTGIDRFTLQQILPGEDSTAFVGTRPPVPDKVSEPMLVLVEHGTGKQTSHSLWR